MADRADSALGSDLSQNSVEDTGDIKRARRVIMHCNDDGDNEGDAGSTNYMADDQLMEFVIKDLPEHYEDVHLQMYLENRTTKDQILVQEKSLSERLAVVSIADVSSDEVSDILDSINKSEKLFLKTRLKIDRAPVKDCILVTQLKPDLDEFNLNLFFEMKNLNPKDLDVTVVEHDKVKQAAIIKYQDTSAIHLFMKHNIPNTSVIGEDAKFEICPTLILLQGLSCLEAKYLSCAAEGIHSSSNSLSDLRDQLTDIVSNTNRIDLDESCVAYGYSSPHNYSLNAAANFSTEREQITFRKDEIASEIHLKNENMFRCDDYNSDGSDVLIRHKKKICSVPVGAEDIETTGDYDDEYNTDESDSVASTESAFRSGNNRHEFLSLRGFKKNHTQNSDYEGARDHSETNQSSESQYAASKHPIRHNGSYRPGRPRRGGRGYHSSRNSYGSAGLGAVGTNKRGKSRADNHNTAVGLSECASERSSSNSQNMPCKRELLIHNEVKDEKCQLLIFLSKEIDRNNDCHMIVDKISHKVIIHGHNDECVENAYENILQCLSSMHSVIVDSVSEEIQKVLQEGSGMKWLQRLFRQSKYKVACYRRTDNNRLSLLATDYEMAFSAEQYLKLSIQLEKVAYSNSHKDFLQSEEGKKCLSKIRNLSISGKTKEDGKAVGGILIISTDAFNQCIVLEGSHDSVIKAKSLIQDALISNKYDTDHITCTLQQMSLLKFRISSLNKSSQVKIEMDEYKKCIKLSGPPDLLKSSKSEVKKLISNITEAALTTCMAGITRREFMRSDSLLQSQMQQLEQKHECVIDVEEGKPQSKTTDSGVLPSGPELLSSGLNIVKNVIKSITKQSMGSNINLVKGDITRFTADVLVNPLCGDPEDLENSGVVSKAFAKAGGQELIRSFSEVHGVRKRIGAITPTYGLLRKYASKIFYIQIKKFSVDTAEKNQTKLNERIEWCIDQTSKQNLTSIAFPTLGCGKLNYPVDFVAKCFKHAAKDFPQVQITVLANDDATYQRFAKYISQAPSSSGEQSMKAQDLKECREFHNVKRKTLTFHIHAFDSDVCKTVKSEIQEKLKNCVSRLDIPYDSIKVSDANAILALQSADVQIDIGESKGKITISGLTHEVNNVHSRVIDIVSKRNRESIRAPMDMSMRSKSRTNDGIHAPVYWRHYKGDISEMSIPEYKLTALIASDPIYTALQKIITSTWNAGLVGKGNDAVGLSHRNITIKKISLVENVSLFKKYERFKKELEIQRGSGPAFPSVASQPGKKEIETVANADSTLKRMVNKDLNECYLFHGLLNDKTKSVLSTGLDGRLCSQTSLFGQGIYLAENFTKADQYADSRGSRSQNGTPLFVFIVKVLLGRTHICQSPRKFKRPPCSDWSCKTEFCTDHLPLCDSVIGTHKFSSGNSGNTTSLLFREFIIYDGNLCYPEFLVEYSRF